MSPKPVELTNLAKSLASKGPHKTLPTKRRIRIIHNGRYIADSTSALYVWEHPYYPQYYFPAAAFDKDTVERGAEIKADNGSTIATILSLKVGDQTAKDAALSFPSDLTGPGEVLRGRIKVNFAAVDTWLEEDTPIYVHPKDPFKRVDILRSTRPITVSVGGTVVARTTNSAHLYETGLPVRYYFPLTDVDQKVLRPSDLRTQCPYKGDAQYYSVEVNGEVKPDIVWYITRPTIEAAAVQGLVCFYNEKVDIEVDGIMEEKANSL